MKVSIIRLSYRGLFCLLLFSAISSLFAQETNNINYIGNALTLHSTVYDIAVKDDYTFLAEGDKGVIVLHKEPDSGYYDVVKVVGCYCKQGDAQGIAIRDNYAYVADGPNGLRILDISDPRNLVEVASYNDDGYCNKVILKDYYAYIANGPNGLLILNINNPLSPQLVLSRQTSGVAKDLIIIRDTSFAVADSTCLSFVRTNSTYTSFAVTDTIGIPAQQIETTGNYAYALYGSSYEKTLILIDLINKQQIPSYIRSRVISFAVYQNYLFLSYDFGSNNNNFFVHDISNVLDPHNLGETIIDGTATSLLGISGYVYAGGPLETKKLDIRDLNNIMWAEIYYNKNNISNTIFNGDLAIVSEIERGFHIVDTSNPAYPALGYYADIHTHESFGIATKGNYVFMSSDSLYTIDISNPVHPVKIHALSTDFIKDMKIVGNLLYTISPTGRFCIFNIGNTGDLTLIGTMQHSPTDVLSLAIIDDIAFIGSYQSGFYIIYIADSTNPQFIHDYVDSHVGYYWSARDFTPYGDYLFITNGGYYVYYIENIFYPDFLYYLNAWASGGTYLYSHYLFSTVSLNDNGAISITDIIDPINPQLIGFCNTPLWPTEITIHNDLIYVSNYYRLGVYSFHVDANEDQAQTVAPMQLNQNYPNPFNPETTIEYSLPKTGQVNLAIYNIKGELVKELVNGVQPSGKNSVVWKGTDSKEHAVSSGIYFYRIFANGSQQTKKMMLIK